jgi:hypothetical protein
LNVVTSGLLRALKTLAPPEFIRLRGPIKAANRDVLLSALDRYTRGGEGGDRGPESDVSEDLLDHRRLLEKKTVEHLPAVLE